MTNDTKFKPGQSGNPKTRFTPGNRHRWQPRQSGNPAGIARSRLRFEESFYTCLIQQGAPDEAASLLWECARKREPLAVLTCPRFLYQSKQESARWTVISCRFFVERRSSLMHTDAT